MGVTSAHRRGEARGSRRGAERRNHRDIVPKSGLAGVPEVRAVPGKLQLGQTAAAEDAIHGPFQVTRRAQEPAGGNGGKMKSRQRILIGSLLLFVFTSAMAFAGDPPGRVARIQYLSGSVSVQPKGSGEWVEAVVNHPLTSSDNVWADKSARAEFNVGTGVARIDSETSLTLADVSDNSVQLQLHQGTLNLHVRKLYDGEVFEVDAPNLSFVAQKSGDYRFDVSADGETTTVTVWKGEGDATGEGRSVHLKSHESAKFAGGATLAHTLNTSPTPDSFDDWCHVRSERQDHSASSQYVSPDMIGSEDLDAYGRWETAPTYGSIWVPTVAAGWAPYRYGHWAWIDPWGWTWVDDAPWGFAPFHYGRWVQYNNYWAWAPGPYWRRAIYSPALVGWYGGRHWGVGLGFGGGLYGWCPLGWDEPFYPWFGVSVGFFGRVNYHVHGVHGYSDHYFHGDGHWGNHVNSRYMTAMDGHSMASGMRVNQHMASVSPHQLTGSPMGGKMDLAPTSASRLGGNAGRPASAPMRGTFDRSVVTRSGAMSGPAPMRSANNNAGLGGIAAGSTPRTPSGSQGSSGMAGRNVPRPPRDNSGFESARGGASASSAPRETAGRGNVRANDSFAAAPRNGSSRSVPRPSGQVMSASAYESAHPSSSYSAPSRSGSSSYGGRSSYGGGYSAPRSSGSYSGGRGSSGSSGGGHASSGGHSSGGSSHSSGGGHVSGRGR
jgi:hypothetical protein